MPELGENRAYNARFLVLNEKMLNDMKLVRCMHGFIKISIHADFYDRSFCGAKTPAKALETAPSRGEPSPFGLG